MRKLLFLFLVLAANQTYAQRTVSGVISDKTNRPLDGVKVSVKSADLNAITDIMGMYSIVVPDGKKTLEFTKEGYKVQIVDITGDIINLTMTALTDVNIFELSLEELMNVEVSSASNIKEKLADVAATMIVMNHDELIERGYNNLSEIIDDLPGMDVSRIYGYGGILNYWRGYRSTFSQPYLVMIDGMEQNDLLYNGTQVMMIVPLSNIEKVEIVYGPVSSVYGANAFMGVINVITKKQSNSNATNITANTSASAKGYFIGDYGVNIQRGKFWSNLAARLESGDMTEFIHADDYYYTKESLYLDPKLWGGISKLLYPHDKLESPQRFASVDFRAGYGGTEIGLQVNSFKSDWGFSYPADKVQLNTLHNRLFYSAWLKQEFKLSDKFTSKTTLRYKMEDSKDGDWVEGYNVTNNKATDAVIGGETVAAGKTVRILDYSYWPLANYNWVFTQDFDIKVNEKLTFTSGLKYEQKFITKQKGLYGNAYTVDKLDVTNEDFYPSDTHSIFFRSNIFVWTDYGVYTQAKYALNENHSLNAGVRVDNNSEYGTSKTFRGGYVGRINKVGFKLLYGQAYQVPTPRTLYSSWSVLGASSTLQPEKSQTVELQLNYASSNFSGLISGYYANNTNTIVQVTGTAKNVGERNVGGIDIHANAVIPQSIFKKMQVWAYYSTYLLDEEQKFDEKNGNKTTKDLIGDLAHQKIYFGATTYFTSNLMLNLRGRYISERKTIETNPIDKIPAYFLMDGNLMYKNLFVKGFDVGIKVQNIFDKTYFHTGKANADAGETPGTWVNGVWNGSLGWDASEVPQPHRFIMFSIMLNLSALE